MFKPSTVAKIIELIGVNIRKIMFYFYFIEIPENQLIFNKNVLCTLKTIRRKMKMKNLAKKILYQYAQKSTSNVVIPQNFRVVKF